MSYMTKFILYMLGSFTLGVYMYSYKLMKDKSDLLQAGYLTLLLVILYLKEGLP